jgi:hypothetical protein
MNTGMLWFDNDPKATLVQKIDRAAEYYRTKYGCTPDLCLVNPAMLTDTLCETGRIHVRSLKSIMPNHLWIGVEDHLPLGAAG